MKKTFIFLAAALLSLAACEKMNQEGNLKPEDIADPVPIELTKAEATVRDASNAFGITTFRSLYTAGGKQDVVFSPLSLSLALSMTAEGANGDTIKQFADVIGWGESTQEEVGAYYKKMVNGLVTADASVLFTSANSFWAAADLPLRTTYTDLLSDNYAAESYTVDFKAAGTLDKINRWCSEKTDGKIPNMLDQLNPQTKLMLINALLFKAPWGLTWEVKTGRTFSGATGKTKKDFLYVKDARLLYGNRDGYETVSVPYGNGLYVMDIVLPKAGKSLSDVLPKLTQEGFRSGNEAEVELFLPKFSMSYSTEDMLIPVLQGQGLILPFSNDADFSGISERPLKIDLVIQKTQIDVTEKGTEFAAVTVVGMRYTSAISTPPKVTVDLDRPFAYAIRETSSNTILLLGTLSN